MKKIKISGKLNLEKFTVASLNAKSIVGGAQTNDCATDEITCDNISRIEYCTDVIENCNSCDCAIANTVM